MISTSFKRPNESGQLKYNFLFMYVAIQNLINLHLNTYQVIATHGWKSEVKHIDQCLQAQLYLPCICALPD